MNDIISKSLEGSARTIRGIDPSMLTQIAKILTEAFKKGNKAIFLGNGGSAADAQHLAAEFTGRYLFDRSPLPAICLSNISAVTAIGNDYSFEQVFSRQVQAYATVGDVVIGISTSGNSRNVLEAMKVAKAIGAHTVSFSGPRGKLKESVDLALVIESEHTPHIQESYMVAGHLICELVELALFGKKAVFIDRDDTIAKDCPYCSEPEDLVLFKGVPGSISRLNAAGYLVIMVTNQSGVSRGFFSQDKLTQIHAKMIQDIEAGGGKVDDIFFCPHHPDEGCDCRKPEIGMVHQACRKHHVNLAESFVIGDSDKDVEMARRCGCRSIQVDENLTFKDAVDMILEGRI